MARLWHDIAATRASDEGRLDLRIELRVSARSPSHTAHSWQLFSVIIATLPAQADIPRIAKLCMPFPTRNSNLSNDTRSVKSEAGYPQGTRARDS
jgi:hypothetical protein